MKRYDIGLGVGHGGFQFGESADGDWVPWADVQQLIKENIVLRAEVQAWRHHDDVHECGPESEWLMRRSITAHDDACRAAQETDRTNALDAAEAPEDK